MKFKEYLNSLVSKRKNSTPNSKSQSKPNRQQENAPSPDCHYDICGYEDVNNLITDDQHSRTQVLLSRHAELVNTIVGTRSPNDTISLNSCTQCRLSHYQPTLVLPPPPPLPPPPLPPKLSFDQQTSFSNRNYSSTLATCSPRRECQANHPMHLLSSQYSTPNPSIISSSSSSLWTTGRSSKKQRSKIRTNPWIGGNASSQNHRPSMFIESSCVYHQCTPSSLLPASSPPEYCVYDPTFHTSPPGLAHSESFPQTTSNGNIHLITLPPPPPALPLPSSAAPAPACSVVLHQSDSGHGFSLSSSRVIDSSSSPSSSPPSTSSSPDSTSADGGSVDDKSYYRQRKLKKKNPPVSPPLLLNSVSQRHTHTEPYFRPKTMPSESGSLTQRTKGYRVSPPITLQYHYHRPTATNKTSPLKSPADRSRLHRQNSASSSSRSIDDHFSLEFEEIVENERLYKQRKDRPPAMKTLSPTTLSPRKSPFILPLEETSVKLASPPPPSVPLPMLLPSTLVKTNSRAILRHIEEIENEIRLIKNLDLDREDEDENEDFILSPHAYPEDDIDLDDDDDDDAERAGEAQAKADIRPSIYDQVDRWVETCLQTNAKAKNPAARLHNECDHLSNTIKDYVVCVCDNAEQEQEQQQPLPIAAAEATNKLRPGSPPSSLLNRSTKRTSSFIDRPLKLERMTTILKSLHECPF